MSPECQAPESAETSTRPTLLELPRPEWMEFLDDEEWRAFCQVVTSAGQAGIATLVGGALGLAAYMPLRRRTKDIDFYVRPTDRDQMIALLTEIGFRDFYDQCPYDREWIYRATRGEVIADVIWSFANQRATVDEDWFRHSRVVRCGDFPLRIAPAEELIWSKLYVLQRERCDWMDILNLIYYTGTELDWDRLLARLGPDRLLLDGLLSVFRWICPNGPDLTGSSAQPANITQGTFQCQADRASLLDSRDWFLPTLSTRR